MLSGNNIVVVIAAVAVLLLFLIFIFVLMTFVNSGKKADESDKIIDKISQMETRVLKDSHEGFVKIITQNNSHSQAITKDMQMSLDKINATNESKLNEIRKANEDKLDVIEKNINEKLDKSLNERLDSSFKTIGDQLATLNETNGRLLSMSSTMTDLQKSLSSVKVRGVFGEKQLENILSDLMTENMFETQFRLKKNSDDKVDFAIKIPNKDDDGFIYLPIDSKFPNDRYLAIIEASERHDEAGVNVALKELKAEVERQARDIRDKYICPPTTTDFAIMFLPTEGLYAEILRIPELAEKCQTDYHILLAGPTTITALINSFSVGFRFLQVNKNSKQIAKTLAAIKTQFDTFGNEIDATKRNIDLAAKSTEKLSDRNRKITDKLKKFEAIGIEESNEVLGIE